MSGKKIVTKILGYNKTTVIPAAEQVTTDTYFDISNLSDNNVVFIIKPTGSTAKVTIYKGDGIQAVEDLTLSVTTGTTAGVKLESMKYKILVGENKGCVKIKSDQQVEITAISL